MTWLAVEGRMETMDSIFHALLGSRNTENPNISNPATARQFDWNDFISYLSFLACGALGRLRWESWCFLWQHLVGGAGISEQLSVQWGGELRAGEGSWWHYLTSHPHLGGHPASPLSLTGKVMWWQLLRYHGHGLIVTIIFHWDGENFEMHN